MIVDSETGERMEKVQSAVGPGIRDVSELSEAFAFFREASDKLVNTYQGLEERISELSRVIREKDQALDSQGQFLDALLKSLSTGVLVVTPGGRILWTNPLVGEWVGGTEEEILKVLSAWGVWPPPQSGAPVPVLWKDRALIVTHSVVRDREKRPAGHVLILTDRTRVREMEEEVSRDRRLKEMGEMVATIAHELRNPLGSLEIFASLAEREAPAGSRLAEWVGFMRVQVSRLDRLIGNLLYYTRPPEIVLAPLSLSEFLMRAQADFARIPDMRSQAGAPRVSWKVSVLEDRMIEADEGLLYHALFNLAVNAFQVLEGRSGGEVHLEASVVSGGDVVFCVRDNGPGIPESMRDRIFNPFFSTKPKGTGLGLSIVHNIVEAHGGSLNVSSRPGETEFRLRIPGTPDARSCGNRSAEIVEVGG
ncbi:MAG: sensor histidine kinase [Leptospirales bacterium]